MKAPSKAPGQRTLSERSGAFARGPDYGTAFHRPLAVSFTCLPSWCCRSKVRAFELEFTGPAGPVGLTVAARPAAVLGGRPLAAVVEIEPRSEASYYPDIKLGLIVTEVRDKRTLCSASAGTLSGSSDIESFSPLFLSASSSASSSSSSLLQPPMGHSAAPPSLFSWCFNVDGEGMSVK